jgi:ribosome-binding protein aMBF1 (putative translation factor)
MSQAEACANLERRKSWLAKIERGQRSLLFSEAVELARLYDVPLVNLWPEAAEKSVIRSRTGRQTRDADE